MIPGKKYFGLHMPTIVEVDRQVTWLVRHGDMKEGTYVPCSSETIARANAGYYARQGHSHIEVTFRTVKVMGEIPW